MTGSQGPDAPDDSWEVMREAAECTGLDPHDAYLISESSRLIWRLPRSHTALVITRQHAQTADRVEGEAAAVRAATAAGVRTPALTVDPTALRAGRFAIGYAWVDGVATRDSWPGAVTEAAKLASADAARIRPLRLSLDLSTDRWADVLGPPLTVAFSGAWERAGSTLTELLDSGPRVLAHGDLNPGNVLVDRDGDSWLIDFEYSGTAPAEWDPAKVIILNRRFGDPSDPELLLQAWPPMNRTRLSACVHVQEVLNVGWLVQMAARGVRGAGAEARRRAASLDDSEVGWRHLS